MKIKKYLSDKHVSEITGRAVQTLRNDRHQGKGIPYIKMGRSVRYDPEDVLAYMEARRIKPDPA